MPTQFTQYKAPLILGGDNTIRCLVKTPGGVPISDAVVTVYVTDDADGDAQVYPTSGFTTVSVDAAVPGSYPLRLPPSVFPAAGTYTAHWLTVSPGTPSAVTMPKTQKLVVEAP